MPDKKQGRPKQPVPVGTDIACMVEPRGKGTEFSVTYWDLWFAIVTEDNYEGNLDRLAEYFREERSGFRGREATGKLSHLRDLQCRLLEAGVRLPVVLEVAGPDLVKQETRRAAGRVLKHNERQFERSVAMRCPPRDRLYPAVLRQHWSQFRVSPEPYAERLGKRFNWDRFYGANASHGLARKLDNETARAQKLLDKHAVPEALAMLRSLVTVAVELIAIADDSFGAIGDSFQEAFKLYLRLPWRESGIGQEAFLGDLVDFLIWEDYGFTYRQTDGYFAALSPEEADFCLDDLRKRHTELVALDLDHQAEEALTLIGQVVAEQRRFELFEDLAREMAAEAWHRIVLLADVAVKAGKRKLARTVFEAALTHGPHLDFLQRKCEQLLADDWDPDPRYKGRS